MKTMHSLKLLFATLMLVLAGIAAQAGIITNNFSVNFDFLASGVQGSDFDGFYIGRNDIPYQGLGNQGAAAATNGNTTVATANSTSNGFLTITSQNTDFGDGAQDDGVFLYKVVRGDFDAIVRVGTPFNPANFNEAGIQARAIATNNPDGRSTGATGQENWLGLFRFDEFGFANIGRSVNNNGLNSPNPSPGTAVGDTNSLAVRIVRSSLTNYSFFQSVDNTVTNWVDISSGMGGATNRVNMDGPLQVGIHHSTFGDNIGTPNTLTARFTDFSITSTDFDAWAAAPTAAPTALAATTNLDHNITLTWTPAGDGSNTLVIVYTGTNLNYIRYAPANGFGYNANNNYGISNFDNALPTSNLNFAVFAGVGSSVIVSNLTGGQAYRAVAYSYNGTTADARYFRTPATTTFVSAAVITNITITTPTAPITIGSSRMVVVKAFYDTGSIVDVSAAAGTTYTSTNTTVATVNTNFKGRVFMLTNGNSQIIVTNVSITASGATNTNAATNSTFTVAQGTMTHRYNFNEPTTDGGGNVTTNVADSIGGENGLVVNANVGTPFITWPGNGTLQFTGNGATVGEYVQFSSNNIYTNYGSLTIEAFIVDSGGAAARVFDSAADGTHEVLLNDNTTGSIQAGGGATTVTASRAVLSNGSPHHLVWTQEGATRTYTLYLDGVRSGLNTNATLTPENAGAQPTVTLGKGLNNQYFNGALDEFRTYNYALSPIAVATHFGNGVNNTNNDPGNILTFVMTTAGSTNMIQDDSQAATVTATFSGVANPLNVTLLPQVSYTSGNTNVVTISATALVTAILPGDSFIRAVGAFSSSVTSTVPIHVDAVTPVLQHRWSFNNDYSDSVGGPSFTAAPFNSSFITTNGQTMANNDPTNFVARSSYIQLPNDLLLNQSSVSLEMWYTEKSHHFWSRIWDLGPNNARYLFYCPFAVPGLPNARNAILVPGSTPGGEQQVNAYSQTSLTSLPGSAPVGTEHHIVYSQDSGTKLGRIFLDGMLIGLNTNITDRPRDIGTSGFNVLGASQFGDTDFDGYINEFRIYNYALSPLQVIVNGRNPDAPFVNETNIGALNNVTVSVPNTTMAVGSQQQAQAYANWANATNAQVSYVANWASSDPTVLKVSTSGLLTAVATGTATVTASYSNQAGTSVTITNTAEVVPTITHRYNFNADFNDSVGTAHGANGGTATLSANAVALSGTASNSYVRLPGHLFDGSQETSIEVWAAIATPGGITNPNNVRVWDFGQDGTTNPAVANEWFGFSPNGAGANAEDVRYSTGEDGVNTQRTVIFRENPTLSISVTNNYLWVFSSNLNKTTLYINGRRVDVRLWAQYGPSPNPAFITNDIGFLGRIMQPGQASGVSNLNGRIDEFRIWSGALNDVEAKASYVNGPDAGSPLATGALTSFNAAIDSTMVVGTIQRPRAAAAFALIGVVDLTTTPAVAYSSANSNIVKVLATDIEGNSRLQAVGAGTVNVTASYGGSNVVASVTVVAASGTVLVHRYNFQSNALDNVNHSDAEMIGAGAGLANNGLGLAGNANFTTVRNHAQLPRDILAGYDKITIESWFTALSNGVAFPRLFDFGETTYGDNSLNAGAGNNNAGPSYFFFTPATGANSNGVQRLALLPGFGATNLANIYVPVEVNVSTPGVFSNATLTKTPMYVAVTLDSTTGIASIYTNGILSTNTTNVNFDLRNVSSSYNYIGRSIFPGDPTFIGNVQEFRIWYGALSSAQVSSNAVIGPDPDKLSAVADGLGNTVVSWYDYPPITTGMHLQRTLSLTPTSWVNVGIAPVTNLSGVISVTVPSSVTNTAFFRLAKP